MADSLALSFWATLLLCILMTLLGRQRLQQVVDISSSWLWVGVSANLMLLLFHFSHPTYSRVCASVLVLAGLYVLPLFIEGRPVPGVLPRVVLTGAVFQLLRGLILSHISVDRFWFIPTEVWLSILVTCSIVWVFTVQQRFFAFQSFVLVEEGLNWLVTKAHLFPGGSLSGPGSVNVYWLTVFMLCFVNFLEMTVPVDSMSKSSRV